MSLKENIKYITQTGTASLFNILVSIVRSKVIAVLIGTSGFGIVGQLNSLLNISHFLSGLGMEQGFVTEISKARRNNDGRTYKNLSNTFFVMTTFMSSMVALIVFLLASQICMFLFDSQQYIWFVQMVSPVICTIGLHIGYTTMLAANKRIKSLVKKSMATSLLSSIFTVTLVYFFAVDGIVYGLVANGLVNLALGAYFIKKNKLQINIRNALITFPHIPSIRLLLKYGSVLMYSSLLYQIVNVGIKGIIIKHATISEVGIYQAATNISKQYMPIFLVSLSTYLLPHIVNLQTIDERIRETNTSLKALLLLATPVLFCIICFSEFIIKLLYSPQFLLSATLLSVLVISDFLGLVNKVASTFLISEKKLKLIFILDTVVALTMYFFVYFTFDTLGLISAIYASIAASSIYFTFVVILLKRECKFTFDVRNYVFIFWVIIHMLLMNFIFYDYSLWFKAGYATILFSFTYVVMLSKSEKVELYRIFSFYLKHYGRKRN